MSADPRIVGLMQVRNEWPLVALSVSHALLRHVDVLYVLDHASSDGTSGGLQALQALWPGRLHVLDYEDDDFWQEACASVLIEVSQGASPDWLYVLDADEFLLIDDETGSLRELLATVDGSCSLLRYGVQNWVSLSDFDDTLLSSYRRLTWRSVVRELRDLPGSTCGDEIRRGNLNFFDLPFGSKVVIRNDGTRWVAAGTHAVKEDGVMGAGEVASSTIRAAHVPFLSRRRLESRVGHGRRMVQGGFSRDHGWQSQMLFSLARDQRLDDFWQSHSVGSDVPGDSLASTTTLPSIVHDDTLVRALAPVFALLEAEGWWQSQCIQVDASEAATQPGETRVPFRVAARVARRLQLVGDAVREERDAAVSRRDQLSAEYDRLRGESEALRREGERLGREVGRLGAELSASQQQVAAVRASASWRVTAPLRAAGGLWRTWQRPRG